MLLERAESVAIDGGVAGPAAALVAPARYGAGSSQGRLLAVGVTAAVHAVLLLGLLGLGIQAARADRARIVAVDLSVSAPERPEKQQEPAATPVEPRPLDTAVRSPDVPQPVTVPRPAITLASAAPQAMVAPPAPPAPAPAGPPPAPPAPPAAPGTVQGGDLGTRVLSAPPPQYPLQSRRRREQGTVELLLTLGTDGAVESISVSRSSGFDRLDRAALSAVRRWRWEPTVQAGAPVRVRGIVAIPFVLAG